MKKYIIAASAFLLFAGISNAQSTQKTPAKPATHKHAIAKKTTDAAKTATPGASAATPAPDATKKSTATAIKRKHHTKSAPKKEGTK